MEYIIQTIGILGAVFSFIAFQCKQHYKILIIKMCGALCFALQFTLLKAYTGMVMNCFAIVVIIINAFLVAKSRKNLPFIILSSVLCAAIGVASWIGWQSIFAVVGGLIVTIAFGVKNPKYLRYIFFFGSLCWLTYDILYFSLGGIITEAFSLISIIIATVISFAKEKRTIK